MEGKVRDLHNAVFTAGKVIGAGSFYLSFHEHKGGFCGPKALPLTPQPLSPIPLIAAQGRHRQLYMDKLGTKKASLFFTELL